MRTWQYRCCASLAGILLFATGATVRAAGDAPLDPKYFTRDKDELVITDIAGWHHPVKAEHLSV
jgi:hypothetical protein